MKPRFDLGALLGTLLRRLRVLLSSFSPRKLAQERVEKEEGRPHYGRRFGAALTPGFVKRRLPHLDPVAEKKMRFIIGYFQVMLVFLLIALVVFFVLKALTSVNLQEPTSAGDVLGSGQAPTQVYYTTQVHRVKNLDGAQLTHEELLSVLVDEPRGKYQFVGGGVSTDTMKVIGDGRAAVLILGNGGPQELRPRPTAGALVPVTPADIRAASPRITTSSATVGGVRGWEISFRPTPKILRKMLLVSFLSLNDPDVKYFSHGDYRVVYGKAYMTRQDKQLLTVDMVVSTHGAKYRLMTQYRLYGNDRLKNLDLRNPNSLPNNSVNP